MTDRILTLAWRASEYLVIRDNVGGMRVPQVRDVECDDAYVWRQGRDDVTLRRDGDGWSIVCTTIGRLLGPRHVLFSARHRRADHAVWEVMNRVIRVTRDEDAGLHAGCAAARWIRQKSLVDEGEDLVL
jgi:hypothetical protein